MRTTDTIEQLRRADPAGTMTDRALDERARADLHVILAGTADTATTGKTRGTFPTRRFVVVAALTGVAATLAVGGIQLIDPLGERQVAEAATPPLLPGELDPGDPAREALLALAERAEADTTIPGDTDRHLVRTRNWNLQTDAGDDRVTSRVVEMHGELRWNADLSGRETSTTEGKTDVTTWPPGEYQGYYTHPLPAERGALLEQLEPGHHISEYGTPGLLDAIVDVYAESTPAPAVRGALLRLLAERDDVATLGTIRDRLGRRTDAFALDSEQGGLPNRRILMFDPATGRLLAEEEVLTERPGLLNVRIPAVFGYSLYL
ncbi:hypothetical protein [Flindersiella endophytica]